MQTAGVRQRVQNDLAAIERRVRKVQLMLGEERPCDATLTEIGVIQTALERVARRFSALHAEECLSRYAPEVMQAELAEKFRLPSLRSGAEHDEEAPR